MIIYIMTENLCYSFFSCLIYSSLKKLILNEF